MKNNLRVVNYTTPLARELTALFDAIPTESVVARLQKTEGRGPKGYPALPLFNAFIASYWMGIGSTSGMWKYRENILPQQLMLQAILPMP